MSLEKNSNKCGPIMAIDFGTKCSGLAISDDNCVLAMPYKAIRTDKAEKSGMSVAQAIAKECKNKNIKQIVLGLPLRDDMSESKMTAQVREFREELESQVSIPIVFSDEYLTSHIANDLLKKKKDKSKEDRDILSAQILLTNYLEK